MPTTKTYQYHIMIAWLHISKTITTGITFILAVHRMPYTGTAPWQIWHRKFVTLPFPTLARASCTCTSRCQAFGIWANYIRNPHAGYHLQVAIEKCGSRLWLQLPALATGDEASQASGCCAKTKCGLSCVVHLACAQTGACPVAPACSRAQARALAQLPLHARR